jgi:hypothetical protein
MIVIPKNKPVIQGLNSFYLNVGRFVEHYSGEVATGGIHFLSGKAEGVVFIDDHAILSGIFKDKSAKLAGAEAVEYIVKNGGENNFAVAVYEIEPEYVHFWSNLPHAEVIHSNLSTEYTDLKKLIVKMQSEKLTGYVEVSINGVAEKGTVFLNMGNFSGSLYPWNREKLINSRQDMNKLIASSEKSGGQFNVYQVKLIQNDLSDTLNSSRETAPAETDTPGMSIAIIEELLAIFEKTFQDNKKGKADFRTLLRRKFVEKADAYDFLDPFAAEFQYADGKIEYSGEAGTDALARGIVDCIKEIAEEIDIYYPLLKAIVPWTNKYIAEIEKSEAGF